MFIIGIAGGSGSGKTTFAKKILQQIPLSSEEVSTGAVALIHQDSYYLADLHARLAVTGSHFKDLNYDHPAAFDWSLLKEHLNRLKAGEKIEVPVYDYRINRRTAQTYSVGPCRTVILEGIYTLWDSEIRNIFDIKIYLNVEADIRFIRRLHRDVKERSRTLDSIIRQYYDTVRPMHHEFLEPTRQYADLVVGEETDVAAEVVAARVLEEIAEMEPQL